MALYTYVDTYYHGVMVERKKFEVDDIDNWLYYIELLQNRHPPKK
jgi:hypothetical protein